MPEETTVAEPTANFDTSALDAILNSALPDPPEPAAAEPAAPTPAAAPIAPTPPPAAKPPSDDPFTPPPSVLGEETSTEVAPTPPVIEEKFPETPEGGFKSKKQENDWRKWGERYESQAKELKLLREASKKAPEPDQAAVEQIEQLKGRLTEMAKYVERTNLIESPIFQGQFTQPIKAATAKAVEAVKAAGADPDALEHALSLKGEARIKAIGELTDSIESKFVARKIERLVDEIESKESERDAVLADVQGNSAKLREQERLQRFQQAQEQEKNLSTTVEQLTDYLANKAGYEFFKKSARPEDSKWNSRIDEDLNELKNLAIKNTDPNKLLMALALGTQTPHYRQWALSLQAQVKERDKTIAELKGTLPNLNGKPAVVPANGEVEVDPNEDLVQAANRILRQMGSPA